MNTSRNQGDLQWFSVLPISSSFRFKAIALVEIKVSLLRIKSEGDLLIVRSSISCLSETETFISDRDLS